MPTYQYACTQCSEQLEAVQSFSDPALTECPVCGGRLRKVFSAVGVVFKGSGFYKTDSRAANGSGTQGGSKDGAATGASGEASGAAGGDKSSGSNGSGGSGGSSGSSTGGAATGSTSSGSGASSSGSGAKAAASA